MNVSFYGVGQWCATFLTDSAQEGKVVKISANGTVAPCGDGEVFCGVASAVGKGACSVQLGGFVTLPYTGSAPALGYSALVADSAGGVKTGGTGSYLVADVDETAQTVTILL